MGNITYRIVTGPDKQSLQEALYAVGKYIDSYWNETMWEGAKSCKLNLEWVCKMWDQKSLYVVIVYDDKTPIGFLIVACLQNMLNGQVEAHPLAAYVDKPYRRSNIALMMGLKARKYIVSHDNVDVIFWDRLVSRKPYVNVMTIVYTKK